MSFKISQTNTKGLFYNSSTELLKFGHCVFVSFFVDKIHTKNLEEPTTPGTERVGRKEMRKEEI